MADVPNVLFSPQSTPSDMVQAESQIAPEERNCKAKEAPNLILDIHFV